MRKKTTLIFWIHVRVSIRFDRTVHGKNTFKVKYQTCYIIVSWIAGLLKLKKFRHIWFFFFFSELKVPKMNISEILLCWKYLLSSSFPYLHSEFWMRLKHDMMFSFPNCESLSVMFDVYSIVYIHVFLKNDIYNHYC